MVYMNRNEELTTLKNAKHLFVPMDSICGVYQPERIEELEREEKERKEREEKERKEREEKGRKEREEKERKEREEKEKKEREEKERKEREEKERKEKEKKESKKESSPPSSTPSNPPSTTPTNNNESEQNDAVRKRQERFKASNPAPTTKRVHQTDTDNKAPRINDYHSSGMY